MAAQLARCVGGLSACCWRRLSCAHSSPLAPCRTLVRPLKAFSRSLSVQLGACQRKAPPQQLLKRRRLRTKHQLDLAGLSARKIREVGRSKHQGARNELAPVQSIILMDRHSAISSVAKFLRIAHGRANQFGSPKADSGYFRSYFFADSSSCVLAMASCSFASASWPLAKASWCAASL